MDLGFISSFGNRLNDLEQPTHWTVNVVPPMCQEILKSCGLEGGVNVVD